MKNFISKNLSAIFLLLAECISIGIVLIAPEANAKLLLLPFLLSFFLVRFKIQINEKIILSIFLFLFSFAAWKIFGHKENISEVLIKLIGVFHALLWIPSDKKLFSFWRLGTATLECIFGATLLPESYIFFLILLFSFFSFLFLTNSSSQENGIKKHFFTQIKISLTVIVIGLILFPIMPRSRWHEEFGTQLGYTENIHLNNYFTSLRSEEKKLLLAIKVPENKKIFLIRGKVLEIFENNNWLPAVKTLKKSNTNRETTLSDIKLYITREDINTEVLPSPYGTEVIQLTNSSHATNEFTSGEWAYYQGKHKRVHYEATINEKKIQRDPPRLIHSQTKASTEKIRSLAKSIQKTNPNKIKAVENHLRRFSGSLTHESNLNSNALENFLFKTKKGHCELFASSAAILLREMSVPTRLVTGFRASQAPQNNILYIYNTDAHAWVEAWVNNQWIPFDPTPIIYEELNWWSKLHDTINAYWYYYILDYEYDTFNFLKENWKKSTLFLILILILVDFIKNKPIKLKKKQNIRLSKQKLLAQKSFIKLEKYFKNKKSIDLNSIQDKNIKLAEWKTHYQEIRFGKDYLEEQELSKKIQKLKNLTSSLMQEK